MNTQHPPRAQTPSNSAVQIDCTSSTVEILRPIRLSEPEVRGVVKDPVDGRLVPLHAGGLRELDVAGRIGGARQEGVLTIARMVGWSRYRDARARSPTAGVELVLCLRRAAAHA